MPTNLFTPFAKEYQLNKLLSIIQQIEQLQRERKPENIQQIRILKKLYNRYLYNLKPYTV